MPMRGSTLLHHNRLRQQTPLLRPQHIQRSRSIHPQSLRHRRPQRRLPRRNAQKHGKPILLHPQRPIRPRPIRPATPHIPKVAGVVVPIRPVPMQRNARPVRIQIRGRVRRPAHRIHRQRRSRKMVAHRPPPPRKTPATASPTTRPTSAAEHTGFVRPAPAASVNTGADSPASPPGLLR